jgi:hypothetical protein
MFSTCFPDGKSHGKKRMRMTPIHSQELKEGGGVNFGSESSREADQTLNLSTRADVHHIGYVSKPGIDVHIKL